MEALPNPEAALQALAAIRTIVEGLITVDRENRVTFMNPSAERMTGWRSQDALGKPSGLVFRIINAFTREPDWQPVCPSMNDDRPYLLLPNSLLVRKDGQELPVEDTVSPMHDELGHVVGAVIVFRDVGSNRETLLRVLERVHRDPLTNLPNRAYLGDLLSTLQDASHHLALLYLDLNHFKQINDTWGHLAGDLTLQVFARRLRMTLPETAVVCRWGGDEFVVLLRDVDCSEDVHAIVGRLHTSFEEEIAWEDARIRVSASIGFAMGNEANKSDLLAIADDAMYRVKRAHRHSPAAAAATPDPVEAQQGGELPALAGLAEHQLCLLYQPIFELPSHRLVGAEALLRHRLPEGQMQLPETFIGQAERSGSIVAIGRAVLQEALGELRRWRQAGVVDTSLAVNVSATELLKPGYLLNLDRLLAEEEYSGEGLVLEVTESVLLQQRAERDIVGELKERQLRVAIDDFGMGYSNLNQLRRSPFDIIKIDRDFLTQVPESDQDMKLVTAMVDMAHSLQRVVIAEGVETQAQRDFLTRIACDQAQGFLFSPPVSAAALRKLLEASMKRDATDVSPGSARVGR